MEDRHKTRRVFDTPGEAHELTFSCLRMMPLLQSEHAKVAFLEELNQARAKLDFEVWAYVLMDNHAHLLVWPRRPKYSISSILRAIKQPVSQRLIAEIRREEPGALERLVSRRRKGAPVYSIWQPGGGYDRNMTSNAAISASIDYIHMNPVRKVLVISPLDWDWSSARQYHGKGLVKFVVDYPK
jgi:putative transposase